MEKWNDVPGEKVDEVAGAMPVPESVAKKIVKNAAIAGVVAMTQLGGVQESSAADKSQNSFQTKEGTVARVVEMTKQAVDHEVKRPTRSFFQAIRGDFQKLKEQARQKEAAKELKRLGLDTILSVDGQYTWGVQYVPKTNEKGEGVLADRYLKIDNKTGERTVLVESAKIYELKEALEKIKDLPEEVLRDVKVATDVFDEEKQLVASGFVEPTSKKQAVGTEVRTYKNWKNTVEVDEDGKVVKILESERIVEESPEKK